MTLFRKNKMEVRTTARRLSVREAEGEEKADVIEGVAIVFGKEYRMTDCYGDTYVERIAPSAVTEEWLKTQDVKLNLLHDRKLTVARCDHGSGSLEVWVEKDGVHFRFEAPQCDLGERAVALVRSGVYSGCSFEFYPCDYTVEEGKDKDGHTMTVVTHTSFEQLDALTIAMDPAYKETSVSVRELREAAGLAAAASPGVTDKGRQEMEEGLAASVKKAFTDKERLAIEREVRLRLLRMSEIAYC